MKLVLHALITAALLAVAGSTAHAEVPTVIPFAGRLLVNDVPIEDGTHIFTFRLYDTQDVGTGNQLWSEQFADLAVADGLVYARLGSTQGHALDAAILDGRRLYLEIVYDNTTIFSPRLALESVPYAVHAGTADTLGGLEPEDLQPAITGDCAGGVVAGIGPNGALRCETDDNSGGTVQTVTAGTGLTGGGSGAAIALAVDATRVQSRVTGTCPAGQYLRAIAADGTVTCATDVDTDTTYTAAAGGGVAVASQQIGLVSCGANQILKVVGGAWTCAVDNDSTTTYTPVAGGGVSISGTQIGLAPCASGQVLKAGATAGTWTCGNDSDTTTTYSAAFGGGVVVSGTQIGLLSCNANQVLKVVGGAWTCAADTDTNTTYTGAAGGGVSVSGTQIGLSSCANGQILKMVGGAWSCAADIDTDTDTNTTYSAAAGGGVALNGTQFGLAPCANGQVLKAGATAGQWSCAADNSNAGTITSVVAGTGLSGGGSSGAATLSVDSSYVQRRVSGACGAGQAVRSIAADGTVTCEPKASRTFLGSIQIDRVSYNGTPTNWTPINYFTFDLDYGIGTRDDFVKPGQSVEARLCMLYTDSGDAGVPVHLRLHSGSSILFTADYPTTFSGSNLPRTACSTWAPSSTFRQCSWGFSVSCALELKHDQNRQTIVDQAWVEVAGVN